ncbi:MAG: class I SAM-dependent methyltransferase [Acidobacteriota bacterium]
MHEHFSEVAEVYNDIRITDAEPVHAIVQHLGDRPSVRAAEIGCGGGRYSLLLSQLLPDLDLICNDINAEMLREAEHYLRKHKFERFSTVRCAISELDLPQASLDCVMTFNTIHHFSPESFLERVARGLRHDGWVFIYTRLRSQNATSIWGRHFPGFSEKETRLYDLAQMEAWADRVDTLRMSSIEFFRFERKASLDQLVHRARNRHYSTFSLYSGQEFEAALRSFEQDLRRRFPDPASIRWYDENVMVVLRKISGPGN